MEVHISAPDCWKLPHIHEHGHSKFHVSVLVSSGRLYRTMPAKPHLAPQTGLTVNCGAILTWWYDADCARRHTYFTSRRVVRWICAGRIQLAVLLDDCWTAVSTPNLPSLNPQTVSKRQRIWLRKARRKDRELKNAAYCSSTSLKRWHTHQRSTRKGPTTIHARCLGTVRQASPEGCLRDCKSHVATEACRSYGSCNND